MFHSNTDLLIDYWQSRRVGPKAPARAVIDPADFVKLLPQVFILGRRSYSDYGFRLTGGFVTDLHRRDLVGQNGLALWEPEDRAPLLVALETARRRAEPLVVDCDAWPDFGLAMRMEVMLAPLTGIGGEVDRMFGLYQPLGPTSILLDRPVKSLSIRSLIAGGEGETLPPLRLAALNGRQIA